ncbi:unnamed protein product [Brassica oleracea var. botrytis]|uniref:ENT domain-containing protein n=1 Tax=Brassica oleracea var. oleracea TaxID=109376 RepID=A0A0D3CUG2_BRAOL|nr:PREDICTED: protein EMSY-LIKE 1 [Brassica oleracea var. oleracea]
METTDLVSVTLRDAEDPKSESNDDDDDDDKLTEEFKKEKLEDLKRKAFYSVLLAFRAETLTIGNKRTHLIEKLMKELNISQETRISFDDNIQENLIAHQQSVISKFKEAEPKPLTISDKTPPLVPTYVATLGSSWGRVNNPHALVGRRVRLRMCCEDEFEDFVVKEYNAKDEMHGLENVDSNAMEMDDELSWVDVREVPPEDIIWRDGEAPYF